MEDSTPQPSSFTDTDDQADSKLRELAQAAIDLKRPDSKVKEFIRKIKNKTPAEVQFLKPKRKQRVIPPKSARPNHVSKPKRTKRDKPRQTFFGPPIDPAITAHRAIVAAKKRLLCAICLGKLGRTPDQKKSLAHAALIELLRRSSEFFSNTRCYRIPRYLLTSPRFSPSEQFDRLRIAYLDGVVPCANGHQLLYRHMSVRRSRGCKLCTLKNAYTIEAYQWFMDNGFDDVIFEWKGPRGVIPTPGRFRFDVLVRMNNGDIVSVEFDDKGHFVYSQRDRRKSDACKHHWALCNDMKVLRISETDNMQLHLTLAFPDGPDTLLDTITFGGPKAGCYGYLDDPANLGLGPTIGEP